MSNTNFNKIINRLNYKLSDAYFKKYPLNQRIRFSNRWHGLLVHAKLLAPEYHTIIPIYKCLD